MWCKLDDVAFAFVVELGYADVGKLFKYLLLAEPEYFGGKEVKWSGMISLTW